MELTALLHAEVDRSLLHHVVSDLGTYPSWLDIVVAVRPEASDPVAGEPAWTVELRGRLGPLSRSKRLRMVRVDNTPHLVRFERRELDGRQHSPWILVAELASVGEQSATSLEMTLRYGGSLWLGPLDRLLRDEIERSRPRLVEVARALSAPG